MPRAARYSPQSEALAASDDHVEFAHQLLPGVDRRILDDPVVQATENAAHLRATAKCGRLHAVPDQSVDDVVAANGQILEAERRLLRQDVVDAPLECQIGIASRVVQLAGSDLVAATQLELIVQQIDPDPVDE